MKKTILFLGFLMALLQPLSAQIREFDLKATQNSIVRAIDDENQLIYTEVSPTESYFLLYHDGDPTALAFPLPSSPSMEIFDFRIVDDEVYFCGEVYTGSPTLGLVGTFNIPTVFSGSGPVNFGVLGATSGNEVTIESLRRLDLFQDGGLNCMAMVGDAQYEGMTTYPVVSAYFNGTNWNFWTDIQKDYPRFTDIACLDNLIVAAGTFLFDSLCFVKSFWHNYDFPAQECNPYNVHYFTYGVVKGDVLIAKERADIAMLACYDVSSGTATVLQRTPFDATTGSPLPTCSAQVTIPSSPVPYGSGQEMLELTVANGDIYLLQRTAYPGFGILDWRLRTPFPSPVIDAWYPLQGTQHSMDVTYALKTSAVNADSDNLQLHGPSWPSTDNNCQKYLSIDAAGVPVGFKETGFQIFPVNNSSSNVVRTVSVFEVEANIICQE